MVRQPTLPFSIDIVTSIKKKTAEVKRNHDVILRDRLKQNINDEI